MLLLAVIRRAKLVQVPVNYRPRVGESSVTGDLGKTIRLGMEMIGMVFSMRFGRAHRRRALGAPRHRRPPSRHLVRTKR